MKLQKTAILLFVSTIIFPLTACKTAWAKSDDLSGTISISSSFALYPLLVKWGEEFKKLRPRVNVDVSAGGAGKGIADALAGVIDIGTASRDIYPEEVKKGAFSIAVAKDAVVPTASAANPWLRQLLKKGVSQSAFQKIWITGEYKTWGQVLGSSLSEPVHLYTRSDASGAGETWAKYLRKKQEDLLGIGVYGDPGIAQALKKDPLSMGYNNISYVFDPKTKQVIHGLIIIPIDLNGNGKIDSSENFYGNLDLFLKAVTSSRYPSPPARDLFLITKGKPVKKEVLEFIRWVLTGGQKYVHESGYINLSRKKLENQLKKLNAQRTTHSG